MRPSSRRRREDALPRDSLACTCSLTRSPAISGGEVYRRRLDFRSGACLNPVDEEIASTRACARRRASGEQHSRRHAARGAEMTSALLCKFLHPASVLPVRPSEGNVAACFTGSYPYHQPRETRASRRTPPATIRGATAKRAGKDLVPDRLAPRGVRAGGRPQASPRGSGRPHTHAARENRASCQQARGRLSRSRTPKRPS